MQTVPFNIESDQIIGFDAQWNTNPTDIENNIVILTRDDIWKLGKGDKTYSELPIHLDTNNINTILDRLSLLTVPYGPDTKNYLAEVGPIPTIQRSSFEALSNFDLDILIHDNSIFLPSYINAPSKAPIGSSIQITANTFSAIHKLDLSQNYTSAWSSSIDNFNTLSMSSGNFFSLTLPNNSGLIGTNISIRCILIDPSGNLSEVITSDVLLTSSDLEGYTSDSDILLDGSAPVISSAYWNDNNHLHSNSYMLSILSSAVDDIYTLSILCSRPDVTISKSIYPAKFIITYPIYMQIYNIVYTISIVDKYGRSDSMNIQVTVN